MSRILILLLFCTSLAYAQEGDDWKYLGPAQMQGPLKPIKAFSYFQPENVEEKSGLRHLTHRIVFKRAQASINRKYIKEAHESVVISCTDNTIGLVKADLIDPNGVKLGTKQMAHKGVDMNKPDNDHHRLLVEKVCELDIKEQK